MEDLLEQANEIQESLGRSYNVPDEIDEADLEAGMQHKRIRVSIVKHLCQSWMRYNSRRRRKAPHI
jgi:hypothetical protein